MDLNNFCDTNMDKVNKGQPPSGDYTDIINWFMSHYGNMSEEQLMKEMMALVEKKKAEGTFDAKKIRAIAEKVAPMLNDEQRAKMYYLLNFLD